MVGPIDDLGADSLDTVELAEGPLKNLDLKFQIARPRKFGWLHARIY